MTHEQIIYSVFGVVLLLALIFDLGLLSKKNTTITIQQAGWQTFFWVLLALAFGGFVWWEDGAKHGMEYISAYLMEWSLSVDNIFVFIIIFSSFGVKEKYIPRVLLIGVLMAIVMRVIFITLGVELVERFHWLLYLFGAFLLFTGYKMFTADGDEAFDPKDSKIFRFMQKFLPLVSHDGNGKYIVYNEKGRAQYTILFVVVVMLAAIDLVFALDSIPAVMGITTDKVIIYTSNIFAVLGLRSLFFLLRGAVSKFDYLQQGIAIVLVFIGLKMLGEHWLNLWLPKGVQVSLSLAMILLCIGGSIVLSILKNKKGIPADRVEE